MPHVPAGLGVEVAEGPQRQDLLDPHVGELGAPVREGLEEGRRLPHAGRDDDRVAVLDDRDGVVRAGELAPVGVLEGHTSSNRRGAGAAIVRHRRPV